MLPPALRLRPRHCFLRAALPALAAAVRSRMLYPNLLESRQRQRFGERYLETDAGRKFLTRTLFGYDYIDRL